MPRFTRLTGQFQGWQEDVYQDEDNPLAAPGTPQGLPGIRAFLPRDESPSHRSPTYDPLSDWLDEPFPEEMR